MKPNLSKTDRIVQLLLDILYWIGIALLIASYIHLAYINRKPVQLNLYNNIADRQRQLDSIDPQDKTVQNPVCEADAGVCDDES